MARFGDAVKRNEPLSRYTVARLGGAADALIRAENVEQLRDVAALCWQYNLPMRIIGGGANVLFGDAGYRGVILVNDAKALQIDSEGFVRAESGISLAQLARETMARGLSGFEWAISVPGTLGGAIVNNAGAHGGEISALSELSTTIYFETEDETVWRTEQLAYRYRESALKHNARHYVVLSGAFRLSPGHDPSTLRARADETIAHRKRTQPPGASLGSMFKNPPGDFAGRLIEAAGLKGARVGGVIISPVHANFFVNTGGGSAADYLALIQLAQTTVRERFGVALELEVEVIGENATGSQ
jgi:UDP-N-acetylmuramate dehydrogenase